MATCFRYCPCHLKMGRTGIHLQYCQLNYAKIKGNGNRLGHRRLKFVVSAELSNAFSVNIGLDSQVNFLFFSGESACDKGIVWSLD